MKEIIKQIVDTFTSPTKMALFAVVATACYGFITGKLEEMQFVSIVTGVTGFYFGQHIPGSSGGASSTSVTSTSMSPAPEPPATVVEPAIPTPKVP